MKIRMPEQVEKIIRKLNDAGHEAYAVGGCVRDSVLGITPQDWDITTSALPYDVKALFSRTVDTGIAHGTVTVLFGKNSYEVTTYRIDGPYEDFRHPTEVAYVKNLVQDLRRRDFTINAMAYSSEKGLVDCFQGMQDLKKGIVRCVGNPVERFNEDALRMLRAVRFSAQLSFEIEEETQKAISRLASNLSKVSKERIQVELNKLLISDHPEKVISLSKLGLMAEIIPEFDRMLETLQNTIYHNYTVGEHTVRVMQSIEKNHYLRWAAFLHDVGKPLSKTIDAKGVDHFYGHSEIGRGIAEKILKRLKFDNKTINYVTRLVKHHDEKIHPNEIDVRKSIYKIGPDIYPYFIKLRRADVQGKSDYAKERSLELLNYIEKTYNLIVERQDCISLKELQVNGKDLLAAGLPSGEEIGNILEDLLKIVIENPSFNQKEILMNHVKKSYSGT